MKTADILILAVVAVWVVIAAICFHRKKTVCGGCAQCSCRGGCRDCGEARKRPRKQFSLRREATPACSREEAENRLKNWTDLLPARTVSRVLRFSETEYTVFFAGNRPVCFSIEEPHTVELRGRDLSGTVRIAFPEREKPHLILTAELSASLRERLRLQWLLGTLLRRLDKY